MAAEANLPRGWSQGRGPELPPPLGPPSRPDADGPAPHDALAPRPRGIAHIPGAPAARVTITVSQPSSSRCKKMALSCAASRIWTAPWNVSVPVGPQIPKDSPNTWKRVESPAETPLASQSDPSRLANTSRTPCCGIPGNSTRCRGGAPIPPSTRYANNSNDSPKAAKNSRPPPPATIARPPSSSRRMLKDVGSGSSSHSAWGTRATVSTTWPSSVIATAVSVSRAFVPAGVSGTRSNCGSPDEMATQVAVPIRVIAPTCFPAKPVPTTLNVRPKEPDLEKTENWVRSRSYTSNESGPKGSIHRGRRNSPGPLPG